MMMNQQLRDLTFKKSSVSQLRAAALATGMRPLAYDGKLKVLRGLTTPEEVAVHAQVDLAALDALAG